MIHLRPDCLVFKMSTGENIPCSAEKVTIELMGAAAELVDQQLIKHAAAAVLHYFRTELKQTSVSIGEFSTALEQVLRKFGLDVKAADSPLEPARRADGDLKALARDSGETFELAFFPRLREELHRKLSESPEVVHFTGLRPCVKQLTGARRWNTRCQILSDSIVEYLRTCLQEESQGDPCALVII